MKSWILYMYNVFFTCWKLGPRWIIYSCHILTLIFPPKSLFSITLILICITLSLVTLLGNHFSFHFIALHCKINVTTLYKYSRILFLKLVIGYYYYYYYYYYYKISIWNLVYTYLSKVDVIFQEGNSFPGIWTCFCW